MEIGKKHMTVVTGRQPNTESLNRSMLRTAELMLFPRREGACASSEKRGDGQGKGHPKRRGFIPQHTAEMPIDKLRKAWSVS